MKHSWVLSPHLTILACVFIRLMYHNDIIVSKIDPVNLTSSIAYLDVVIMNRLFSRGILHTDVQFFYIPAMSWRVLVSCYDGNIRWWDGCRDGTLWWLVWRQEWSMYYVSQKKIPGFCYLFQYSISRWAEFFDFFYENENNQEAEIDWDWKISQECWKKNYGWSY